MSSNGFVSPIEIRPARRLTLAYLTLQAAAATLASVLVPIPGVLRVVLGGAVLLLSAQAAGRYWWRHERFFVSEAGEWRMVGASGQEHRLELLRRRSFWFAGLAGLTLRHGRTVMRIWVTAWSAGPDNWRRLQTRLRFP